MSAPPGRPRRRAIGPAGARAVIAAGAARPARLGPRLEAALLWAAAAAISGFTLRRYLEPFDEGLLLQAVSRMSAGQWPYRDFGWAYGPGQPLVLLAAAKALGPSVLWWRLLRIAADATIAVLAWALVRPAAGALPALAAWLAAAVTIAQPTSANPFAVALAFALAAVLAAARRRPLGAGLLVALAAFWRLDFGAFAALGAVAATAALPPGGARTAAVPLRRHRRGRGTVAPPRRPRSRGAALLLLAAVAVAAGALLYAPFVASAGPQRVWDALVVTATRDGAWWRLPFPVAYHGTVRAWPPGALAHDAKDVLGFSLPLLGVAGMALAAVATLARRTRPPAEHAGLLALGAGAIAYLLSRPDELHVQPLLVCLCALVPLLAGDPGAGRIGALPVALTAILALIALAGLANRLSALLLPPDLEAVRLPGVPAIRVPPAEAAALPPLVARVQRLDPPGGPIYVAPRRSDLVTLTNPLVHFLVRRPNVLHRDVLLQARPAEQARIVAALRRRPPRVVVRWTDPASDRPEPNPRGRPSGSRALDVYLARAYRLDARFGAYDVLVPRRGAGTAAPPSGDQAAVGPIRVRIGRAP